VTGVIGEFLNSHLINTLVVNGDVDARTKLEALPVMEPRGELLVRFEPDRKRLYIAASTFRRYCTERQIHYKDLTQELQRKGVLLGLLNKRLSKGMKMVSPPVRVIEMDVSSGEFDGYLGSDAGDRDSQVQD
jgi:hypothetical protein